MSSFLTHNKSFTLIELLIVIGILAILTAAVVVVLNPSELLKQSRDSKRIADLASLTNAIKIIQTQNDISLGSSTRVYVSIPDTSNTCSNLSLPTLPTGYTYYCVSTASSTNINGTGWLPINFTSSTIQSFSALPLDPINTTSSGLYYLYFPATSTFWLTAVAESIKYTPRAQDDHGISPTAFESGTSPTAVPPVFPIGWIKVPGNSTFSTSDFYVMQFEAKCVQGNTPLTYTDAIRYYNDSTYPCTPANGKQIASTADGYPITNVSQAIAVSRCTSIGAHLMTNNEWQTIAWNIQQQPINWSGGVVGSGYLSRGNSNANLIQDGLSEYGLGYTDFTHKRTHILSNGVVIWDLAGNVYEFLSDIIIGTDKPVSSSTTNWVQWTTINNFGSLSRDLVKPIDDSYTTTMNIGMYLMTAQNSSTFAFSRGGRYASSDIAGIENLYFPSTASVNNDTGFRCVK